MVRNAAFTVELAPIGALAVVPLTLTHDVEFRVSTHPISIVFEADVRPYTVEPSGAALLTFTETDRPAFGIEYETPLGTISSGPFNQNWELYLVFDRRDIASASVEMRTLQTSIGGVNGSGTDPSTGAHLDFALTPPLGISVALQPVPEGDTQVLAGTALALVACLCRGRRIVDGEMNAPDPTLWYFAYGSNLDPGTFLGRRRMRPLDTRVGRLDGFELRFDLPVGPGERGVANVAPGRASTSGAWPTS